MTRGSSQGRGTGGGVVVAQDLRVVRAGREILAGVDLAVRPRESVAVLGRGDSADAPPALLHLLAGMAVPDTGWIHHGGSVGDGSLIGGPLGRRAGGARRRSPRPRRPHVGVVLDVGLLPELPVLENIALPLMLQGVARHRAAGVAADLLDTIDLSGKGARHIDTLDPGERLRVVVGRALVTGPPLVVATDSVAEPPDRAHLVQVLLDGCAQTGSALVLGTDSPVMADRCSRTLDLTRRAWTASGSSVPQPTESAA